MKDCLFCQIAQKKVPAKIVYEDKEFMAFYDIHPKAPLHILIIPKKHIPTINDLKDKDACFIGRLILVAKKVAQSFPQARNGYKLIFNVGPGGGQVINHIHLHLLAGKGVRMP